MEKTETQGRVQEWNIAGENEIMNRNLWEQRRYELAKEIFLRRIISYSTTTFEEDITDSVAWADRLIAELQKGK